MNRLLGNFARSIATATLAIGIALLVNLPAAAQNPATLISIDQAIQLAIDNSPTAQANRTQIDQSRAQEITAGLRPNPLLSWDALYLPIFQPNLFSESSLTSLQEFDIGAGYLIERGKKRQRRLDAARDQTGVVRYQVADAERTLTLNVAQQFINVLLAKSTLEFATQALKSFQNTVNISEEQYKAGDISQGDFLKIKLQLLQFQTDVTSAQVAKVQALGSLRQLVGFDSVARDYDVVGDLEYEPLHSKLDDLEAIALNQRPDLIAARQAVHAAESQLRLAQANGKQDLNVALDYTHVSDANTASAYFNIPLAIFNRNQGEIARTRYADTQAQLTAKAAEQGVVTDVRNSYEAARTNEEVVKMYNAGYLKDAQQSLEISQFAYHQGAARLLDFLDAERSYRASQLAYRQALATYMLSLEQLRASVAVRNLP